jgi:hypothetical protein
MASAIPPPHVPFVSGSSSLLDVPRLGAPRPFSSSIPVFVLVFCYITFLFVYVFFAVSANLLRTGFAALRPLLGLFRAPTATSFHRTLLCTWSTYTWSVSFPVFLFACINFATFLFPVFHLLFACNNALTSMVRLDPF